MPTSSQLSQNPSQDKPSLNPALFDFWMTPARNRVLYGGRSSSKSWDAAGFAVYLADNACIRVCCARQFQNKITESVYTLLKIQIERFGLNHRFDIQNNVIRNKFTGAEFVFYGIARNLDEIKSLESIDILWIEEAHALTKTQWEVLEPTIRKQGSQCWLIFNPRFLQDFSYQNFVVKPPPNTIKRLINYDENPFLSDTILEIIEAKKEEDYEDFQHIYKGIPREDTEGAIIRLSYLQSCIDAHLKIKPKDGNWENTKTVGFDVADDGQDLCADIGMDGSVCKLAEQWRAGEDELFESTERTLLNAKKMGASSIGYDSIGVGAGTGSNLKKLKWTRHYKFNAGSGVVKSDKKYGDTQVTNKEFFSNLKAQAWWTVADRVRNTHLAITKGREFKASDMISFSSKDLNPDTLNQLLVELSTPKRDYDNSGRVKVESKKDLAAREVDSPNLADAFIIANARGMLAARSLKEML